MRAPPGEPQAPGAPANPVLDLFPQGGADARRLLGVLWKWRWLVLSGAIAGFAFGLVDVLQRRPIYRASAHVLVERQGPKLLKFVDQDGWILPPDIPPDTHARLMRTSPMAARVAKAKTKELAGWPAYAAAGESEGAQTDGVPNALVDLLLGGLEARPSKDEYDIVDVTYTSEDPDLAALLANAFAEEYIAARIEASLGISKNVTEWVDARLHEQKQKLTEAETRLQTWREKNRWVGPENEGAQERIAGIRAQKDEIARAKSEAERRKGQLAAQKSSPDDAGAVAEVAASKVFQDLVTRVSALRLQVAEAETRLGPKHQDMKRLQGELAAAEEGIRREIGRIEKATVLDLDRLKSREAELSKSLASETSEALESSRRQTEFASLEREVELNRQLYDTLLKRLKQLGLAMDSDRANIRVVEAARVPRSPLATRSLFSLLQALGAGLLFSVGIAFLWEWADSTVKTPEELEAQFGLPVLGVVPSVDTGKAANGNGHANGHAPWDSPIMADAFGAVRSAVVLSSPGEPPRALLVTSPGASEGKSTVAMNLAAAMARDGVPTLLVEADLRHPVLHARLGIDHLPGLTELLTSRQPLKPVVRATASPNLFFLASGSPAPNPSELLGSERMVELIREARTHFGRIVIDSPPVFAAAEMLALADATVLAAACDGVLMVVRARKTTRQALARARSRLLNARARFLGAVLNDWKRPGPSSRALYYDGYGYGYYAPKPAPKEEKRDKA